MATISYEKATFELVRALPERFREILSQRFGLGYPEPATLEDIGRAHSITRERVRQIVQEGLRLLREELKSSKKQTKAEAIFDHLRSVLAQAGSVRREDILLEMLQVRDAANYAIFFLTLGDDFYNQRETREFYPFWALKKELVEKAPGAHELLTRFFEQENRPALEDAVAMKCGNDAVCYLEVSKRLMRAHDGAWGLSRWPQVNPRGMKDKAFIVLQSAGKPMHFTEVAKAIAGLQSRLDARKAKPVLPQTVHNELIKDPRFVLVGRGTYGLKEWGLQAGTVQDIVAAVLKASDHSLSKKEIIERVLERRKVKESTVQMNLQNRKVFLRHADGSYSLKV
ncbi:MAG: hypothetical protein HY482_00855 [Candidatus Wildermuthbacteria bacterium]|nr:hypothetical protein [Candidatus Wildermuthbacteria bacterium]